MSTLKEADPAPAVPLDPSAAAAEAAFAGEEKMDFDLAAVGAEAEAL